jgi:hypothetical protein
MRKVIPHNSIKIKGGLFTPILPLDFFFYRELLRILPKLIISSLNQKLTIQLNDLLNNLPALSHMRQQEPAYITLLFNNGAYRGAI